MAEAFTSYSIENDKLFKAGIKRAQEIVSDLRIPFGLILMDFYKSQQAIFKLKSEGQYPPFKGDKYKNGMTKYQYYKKKKVGFDYPLLVRTGALSASTLGQANKGSISKITPLSLTWGSSINYGIYHQSDRARTKIPLRKFLFIGAEAKQFATSEQMGRAQRWLNILNDFVLKKMKTETPFK